MRVCTRHNLVSLLGNREGWRVETIFHLSDPHTLTSAYPCHEWKGGGGRERLVKWDYFRNLMSFSDRLIVNQSCNCSHIFQRDLEMH